MSTFNPVDDDFSMEKNLKGIMKENGKSILNSLVEVLDNMVKTMKPPKWLQ